MNKLWMVLTFLFGIIIVVSLAFIVVFYRPSIVTQYIAKENKIEKKQSPKNGTAVLATNQTGNSMTNSTLNQKIDERLKNLEKIVPSFFVKIQEGIIYHPALLFKVYGTGDGTSIHILTFSSMEWKFIRTSMSGANILSEPDRVYLCNGEVVDVNYVVHGIWPPEVPRGTVDSVGLLVIPEENGTLHFANFSGNCTDDGFVFNPGGELGGICSEGKFIDSSTLYSKVPDKCQLIYKKEKGGNANVQSKNG